MARSRSEHDKASTACFVGPPGESAENGHSPHIQPERSTMTPIHFKNNTPINGMSLDLLKCNPDHRLETIAKNLVGSTKCSPAISRDQVLKTITEEPVFRRYFEKNGKDPATEKWLADFTNALNATLKKSGGKGVELVYCFPRAYADGRLDHIALGAIWRNEGSDLEMGIVHQESTPAGGFDEQGKPINKGLFQAENFSTFDVGDETGYRPIEDAMQKNGLPLIRMLPCEEPSNIKQAYEMMKNAIHPYGGFGAEFEHGLLVGPVATCFTMTVAAHTFLHKEEASTDTRPISYLVKSAIDKGIIAASHDSLRFFTDKRGKKIDIDNLKPGEETAALLHIGSHWKYPEKDWDVTYDMRLQTPKPNL
jgi:hypothetical protein